MSRAILFSMIGEETIPNYRAYKENPPNFLVHIYTSKTQVKSTLIESLVDKSITTIYGIKVDGFDYQSIINELRSSDLQLTKNDFITINITGGTKMMAIALVDYIRELELYNTDNVKFYYVDRKQKINWYLENKLEDFCEPLLLEEIIELQGQKIKSKDSYVDVANNFNESLEELNISDGKKEWDNFTEKIIAKVRKERDLIQKQKQKNQISNFELVKQLSNDGKFNNYEIIWEDNEFVVLLNDIELYRFNLSITEIDWFIFNAGWFELLTANRLSKKYQAENIYMNVLFPALSNIDLDKNEVDILVNDNGNLIFIECKSGFVTSHNINSIKIRQETYGGAISKSILVLRRDLPRDDKNIDNSRFIEEKCKDLDIEIARYNLI